jgi:competence protein ComEC
VFVALGFLLAQLQACRVLCAPFPERLIGKDLEVAGIVSSLPAEKDWATRFLFRIDEARLETRKLRFKGMVRLSWYRNPPPLNVGERWRMTVRLKPPHGFANLGGFDYERWLFQQGIRATGHLRTSADHRLLDPGPGAHLVDRGRQILRDHIGSVLGDSAATGLVQALVLGDRSGLEPAQWKVLTRTGTNHLIAISGLHVGLVATLVFFLVRWLWSRSQGLVLRLAAPRAAALAAMTSALAYSALAGFAVSTQRAVVMLAVVLGAVFWGRVPRPTSGLGLALAGVLLLDPSAVLSYGFWLSFGAVTVLLYAMGRRLPGKGLWRRWGHAQWVVALGLLPLLLVLFGRASLISPLVNLIAVPLFSAVLLPAVLLTTAVALIPGLEWPLVQAARLLEGGFSLLQAASAWEWSSASASGRPLWAWAAVFSGTLLLLAPRGLPGRWLGLVLMLPLPLSRPAAPVEGEVWLSLLDVGQGLSAVVRTRRHTLVYDTGPRFSSGFNTGSAVVLPFLKQQGVKRIDTLVLSHSDRDHTGGFEGLAAGIPIGRILAGEADQVRDERARACRAGQRWEWDGVGFAVLHPSRGGLTGNDSSCVLRVFTTGASVMLPGDVGRGVEAQLAATEGGGLESTVLVAAHHGSDTSTSRAFLDAVSPHWVLYSTGFANRFGFPSDAVRERVARLGASELDTSVGGAIHLILHATGLEGPRLHRLEHRRVWTDLRMRTQGSF